MEELKGLFKLCAGCSHLVERSGLDNGQFYCRVINKDVDCSRDAMDCEYFDGVKVIIPYLYDLQQIVFE